MSEIITLQHRHYIGTVAEIAGITGVCGDTAYETDTHIYKSWNGLAWIVGGKSFYVPRDLDAFDFDENDFTIDSADHVDGLDLTGIVPAGAIAVGISMSIMGTSTTRTATIFRSAVYPFNRLHIALQVAHSLTAEIFELVPIDADRLMDYNFHSSISSVILRINGWLIRECL